MKKALKPFVFLALSVLVFACKEKQVEAPQCGFDVLGMQTEMHKVVKTRIDSMRTTMYSTVDAASDFFFDPTNTNFTKIQSRFNLAYKTYQRVSCVDVEGFYNTRSTNHVTNWLNSFPPNEDSLNLRMQNGITDIDAASDQVSGFPGVEYLLYGFGNSEQERLTFYQNNEDARQLLYNLLLLSSNFQDNIYSNWVKLQGQFRTNSGNANGDPLSLLVNALIKDFEYLKNFKLKNPAGRFNGGIPRPEFAEGKYSEQTFDLAYCNYKAFREFITGKDQEIANPLINYIRCLDTDLADRISNQFDKVDLFWIYLERDKENMLSVTNSDLLNALINEMQKLTPLLKAEMTSKLNISITFQDNDGD